MAKEKLSEKLDSGLKNLENAIDGKELKSVSDYAPKAFEGLEQVDKDDLLGKPLVIHEIKKLTGSMGKTDDEREFFAVRYEDADGKMSYFQTGAKAIKAKLKAVSEKNGFPVRARISKRLSEKSGQEYYDIE